MRDICKSLLILTKTVEERFEPCGVTLRQWPLKYSYHRSWSFENDCMINPPRLFMSSQSTSHECHQCQFYAHPHSLRTCFSHDQSINYNCWDNHLEKSCIIVLVAVLTAWNQRSNYNNYDDDNAVVKVCHWSMCTDHLCPQSLKKYKLINICLGSNFSSFSESENDTNCTVVHQLNR